MAAGRGRAAAAGGTLQGAAFEERKLGILAFALQRVSVSLYLFFIYSVHWGWVVLPVGGPRTFAPGSRNLSRRHCVCCSIHLTFCCWLFTKSNHRHCGILLFSYIDNCCRWFSLRVCVTHDIDIPSVSRLSVRRCVEYNSDGMYQAGAWIMEVWGLDRLKICRRNQSILWPVKCHILSFKTVDGQRCKFHIVKDERLSHKWKVKLIYRGTWNSLMDGPQLTWLTSTSLFYDRSTRLTWYYVETIVHVVNISFMLHVGLFRTL